MESPKEIIINDPNWIISNNFVVDKGKKLIVSEGTTIDMINNAGIISYGEVIFKGTKEKPIVITSSDNTGSGILVFFARIEVRLKTQYFLELRHLKNQLDH